MSLETVKEFFGTVAWNALLASALAVLVFAGGRVIFAVLRRLLRLEGFRFTINLFLLLVAAAAFEHVFAYTWPATVGRVLQVLIFVVGIFLAYGLLEHIFLRRTLKAAPVELPRIVRDVLRLAIIVLAVLFALKAFMGFEPTALIATSTVLSAVIGLAMQDVLANIFAGVSLQIGKPFRVGDWVTVYNQTGTVVSTSWRATRIKTRDNHLIEIPNANIAKTEIYNYSVPTPLQRRDVEIGVVYGAPPNKVKRVLREAALAAQGVLSQPEPDVLLTNYGDFAITYRLRYWLNDFGDVPRTEDRIMTNIWYHFKRAGLAIPFPIRDVTLRQVDEAAEGRAEEARLGRVQAYLDQVDLLAGLSPADRKNLAAAAAERHYAAGERIARQGEAGAEFFLVASGEVRVTVRQEDGRAINLGTYSAGYFFGEMSLLTGEPRLATVTALADTEVLVLDKEEFQEFLAARPKVAGKLSRAIEKRQAILERELAEAGEVEAAAAVHEEYTREKVLKKIKEFFDLS